MCTMCALVEIDNPNCVFAADSQVITEGADAAANTATSYTIAAGDTFSGTLASGDHDWVRIEVVAGQTYQFDLMGSPSGVGTLADPFLNVYSSTGSLLASNDDGGNGYESRITFTASTSGYIYLDAGGYSGATGTYQMSASEVAPPEAATLDVLAEFLVSGYWESTGRVARHFDTSSSNVITVDVHLLTTEGQQLARWALEAWSTVANLSFVETTGTAMIEFDDWDDGAYSTSTTSGAFIIDSFVNIDTAWLASYGTTINSYGFQTYVHEIGHALGLGHQGAYNGSASYPTDATYTNDSWQVSIMSYFDQTDNTTINASYAYDITPMMSDILATQSMYGASTVTSGATVYGRNTTLTGYLATAFNALATGTTNSSFSGDAAAFTIYDNSGIDMIDVGYSSADQMLSLVAESFSNVNGLIGNLGIARGTVIENAITGSGNDHLTGNAANNSLRAGSGNDTVLGGDGSDTLSGEDGADSLVGGTTTADLRDVIFGGEGNDTIDGGYGNDELRGDDGDDAIEGYFGSDTLIGGTGNDTLSGSALSDQIFGGDGSDFLNGGFGHDRMNGGAGADRFYHLGIANHGSDWVQDYNGAEDTLVFGNAAATRSQFQINYGTTVGAGDGAVQEAFVVYRPTGQVIWALVDGAGQDHIWLQIGAATYDLMA